MYPIIVPYARSSIPVGIARDSARSRVSGNTMFRDTMSRDPMDPICESWWLASVMRHGRENKTAREKENSHLKTPRLDPVPPLFLKSRVSHPATFILPLPKTSFLPLSMTNLAPFVLFLINKRGVPNEARDVKGEPNVIPPPLQLRSRICSFLFFKLT